jgi:small GTP-binding protein
VLPSIPNTCNINQFPTAPLSRVPLSPSLFKNTHTVSIAELCTINVMGGSSSKNIKVMIVGPADAGKTTLLYRMKLKNLKQAEFSTTTGFNFENIAVPGTKQQLSCWDLAGAHERQKYWKFFYESVHVDVLLFVVSLDHKKKISDSAQLFRFLRNEERLRGSLKLVVANSDDEKDVHSKASIEDVETAFGIIQNNPHERILTINALTGVGLDTLFLAIQDYYS